ncbi:phospholipid-transporting ATPase ABCA1-like [Leptopilina boulardi]|uniref:phospholipid-transporting ATPase ABCA1-like n=1 Tax=Leptopilina boulardi TaxID=63433 RepID=UPI0021F63220|nr:phospholipid-transporting ATPase ABCA1-like [Leptopilina boulardi]
MASKWRLFTLLMWKNFTVRKRHWKNCLFGEILIPVFLFILIQAVRDFGDFSASPDIELEVNDIIFPVQSKGDLLTIVKQLDPSIYYIPKNNYTQNLMEKTRNCLGLHHDSVIGFYSEDELMKKYTSKKLDDLSSKVVAIVFKNSEQLNFQSKHLEYIIRPYSSSIKGINNFLLDNPFVQTQMCLDESFLKITKPHSFLKSNITMQRMPSPSQILKMKPMQNIIGTMYAIVMVYAFLIPLTIETTFTANEKDIGVNVLMSMNGVKTYQNLRSWLISGILFSIFYVVPRLILFKISFSSKTLPYLYHGNILLVGIMFFAHVAHLLAFGIHITSYFSKSIFRSLVIPIIYIGSYNLQKFLIWHQNYTIIPYMGIFFPNMLLYRLCEEIDYYEGKLIGVGWKNFFVVGDKNYTDAGCLGNILIFSILGLIIHFSLALYASALFPGKYGVPKHPLYFLKFFKSKKVSSEEESYECNFNNLEGKPFESVPQNVYTPGIQIRNLKKSYITNWFSGTKHDALQGISIDFYKGQITTLLGHNGAGKTTMMSILTGILSPSEGTVFINGKNISEELEEIITDVGLCPQEDILFPDFTVFEQIQFFGLLKHKNRTRSQVSNDVYDLLLKLKLSDKWNQIPAKLSGGQKRRVCLGMAIIGNASTLILDEPTSGMDPETRRESWDILLKMRGEKTILISTHNMEEADVLGDRTAIIELGKLKSYGTPLFLKKFYGEGNMEVTLSTEDGCDIEEIKKQFSVESQLISFDGGKIVFSIPFNDRLPNDLDKIEDEKTKLGVTGISVSLITLEQVFLRATKEDNSDPNDNDIVLEEIKKVEGYHLILQSLFALFKKKFSYLRKNILTHVLMILLPSVGIMLMAAGFKKISYTDEKQIRFDNYPNPIAFYYSNNTNYEQMYKSIIESFNGKIMTSMENNISSALLNFSRNDLSVYQNNLLAAATFESIKSQKIQINALYSDSVFQSVPISFNLITNTIIKIIAGQDYQIDISIQNLPKILNFHESIMSKEEEDITKVVIFIVTLLPALALYVIHPLKELSTGIKDLQRMTGVTSYLYWGSFFLFDFLLFLVTIIIILISFYFLDIIMDLRIFYGTEIGIMFLSLILLAMSSFPFIYIFSFLKKKVNTVVNILIYVFTLSVVIESILEMVIQVSLGFNEKLMNILSAINTRTFMLIPSVSFFYGQVNFFQIASKNAFCRKLPKYLENFNCDNGNECCDLKCSDGVCEKSFEYFGDFSKAGSLGECLIYLALTSILYFIILELFERNIISLIILKLKKKEPLNIQQIDDQVANEKSLVSSEINRIENKVKNPDINGEYSIINTISESESIYLVHELSKYYGDLAAVKEISFSVKKKECFGLLGVNGAGKSTTFRMLTGLEFPNSGTMYLNEKEISLHRTEYLRQMGYCPQNHALIESLNSREHLELFASLRGVPLSQISSEVENWIKKLKLNLCANQQSGNYSGGNKRRLNIAIALIGNPNLVLLDEPTTGVDPAARRSLWRVIKTCQLAGQSIILTSHSMEECEALCNRLVIMVKGQFVCIGPSEQLKQRFGAGFDISIKLNPSRSAKDVLNVKEEMLEALECELRDEHVGYLTYHVTNSTTKWETMYGVMKSLKDKYNFIEDYSILSATLEQLFLQFARADNESSYL